MTGKILYYIIGTIFFACLFSSCITNKQKTYLQGDVKTNYQTAEYQEYRLRINDEVAYTLISTNQESRQVFNASDVSSAGNSNAYRIYEDGTIYLPFIGQIKIEGLTIREAQELLMKKFRAVVPDAELKLTLVNNYFYMLGDKGKGQFYMYKDNLNIFQALAMAGDISSMGDKKNIKIIRKSMDGTDQIYTFDLRQESIIESEFYYVQPNDAIYIPTNSNSFFRVESLSSFVSMFVAPLSLLFLVLSTF